MTNLIIFDADSIIWTVAYKFRNKKLKRLVLVSLNKFIADVIKATKATHYIGFYGSKEEDRAPNFRYAIDAKYKGQRPEEPEWLTKWRPVIHKEMTDNWGFAPVDGMEADDACSIAAEELKDEYDEIIITTADKDLLQIPNVTYYNFSKHTTTTTDTISSSLFLATQMLTGDTADNIKGLYKIGPVKAKDMLEDCDTEVSIWWTIRRAYIEKEEELYQKAVRLITREIKKDIADSDWAKNKTDVQIERKVKIDSKSKIKENVEQYIPNGWKSYFRMQLSLLTLLTESPDGWTTPTPVEYKDEEEEVDKGTNLNDDFLYKI